jgi:hypothetical protein
VDRRTVAYLGPHAALELPAELQLPAGHELIAVVADDDGHRLARALRLIASGAAQTLFTPKLSAVAGSLGELVRLLEWLAESGGDLVAADVELDTASAGGRRAAALLREIERWDREPGRPRRPRGRPGLKAESPALVERITAMRERGLSLHAIADELNREGLPTARGGSAWRASSVQSALGYRRPRPPAPSVPPPGGPPNRAGPPKRPRKPRP